MYYVCTHARVQDGAEYFITPNKDHPMLTRYEVLFFCLHQICSVTLCFVSYEVVKTIHVNLQNIAKVVLQPRLGACGPEKLVKESTQIALRIGKDQDSRINR